MKMKIDNAPDGLYEEIAELCTRRGATINKPEDSSFNIVEKEADEFTFNGTTYCSLESAMHDAFHHHNIRIWTTVQTMPTFILKAQQL